MIEITIVNEDKRDFLPLLLLGDEQESSIEKYLDRGELFCLNDGDLKSVCIVTDEGDGTVEIQNIATDERCRNRGYATKLIDYVSRYYAKRHDRIILGTGDAPGILRFYEQRGFTVTHRVPDYFIERYDHPIIEEGILLKDKVYLEKALVKMEMTAEDAITIIKLLELNEIELYVVGGWGVDALLGEQTREHNDLDIALPHRFVPKLRGLLEERGYKDVPRPDTSDCNFVLGDDKGHLVDVHSYTFDENGNNVFGIAFEPYHLTGSGKINGYPVNCAPPEVAIEFRTGYNVAYKDYRDVKAICERFVIPIPEEYQQFEID